MNRILHLMTADFIRYRTAMLWFFATTGVCVICTCLFPISNSVWLTVAIPSYLKIFIVGIFGFIAASMGFFDSPLREDHFLSTRPVNRRELFIGKAIIVVSGALVMGISQTIICLALRLEQDPIGLFSGLILWGLILLFGGAFFRLNVSQSVRCALLGILLLIAYQVLEYLNKVWSLGLELRDPDLLSLLLISCLAVIAAFEVNLRFLKKPSRALAGVAVGAGIAFLIVGEVPRPSSPALAPAAFTEVLKARGPIGITFGKEVVNGEERLTITPDFDSYVFGRAEALYVEPSALQITSASGELIDLGRSRAMFEGGGYSLQHAHTFAAFLDDASAKKLLERAPSRMARDRNTKSIRVAIPDGFSDLDEEITIQFSPRVFTQNLVELGEIKCEEGASFRNSDFFVKLAKISLGPVGPDYVTQDFTLAMQWASGAGRVHVIINSPSSGKIWHRSIRAYSEFSLPGQTGGRKMKIGTSPVKKSDANLSFPDDMVIRFFKFIPSGKATLPAVSARTTLRKLFGSPKAIAAQRGFPVRSSVDRQSAMPVLNGQSLDEYFAELEGYEYSVVTNHAVTRHTVDRLARSQPDALLGYLERPHASRSVRSLFINALSASCDERLKERVLHLLEKDPSLTRLVARRGWLDDAREIILTNIRNASYISYDQRNALVLCNDRESLDLLLERVGESRHQNHWDALLASEDHKKKAQVLMSELEKDYLQEVALQRVEQIDQSKFIFFVRNGSVEVLHLVLEKLAASQQSYAYLDWGFKQVLRKPDLSSFSDNLNPHVFVAKLAGLEKSSFSYDPLRKLIVVGH